MPHRIPSLLASACALAILAGGARGAGDDKVDFETQIAPLFESKCLKCHQGDKPKTSDELGIALKTLYNKLNQYQSQTQAEAG